MLIKDIDGLKFPTPAHVLASAARDKAEYHAQRVEFWTQELEKATKAFKKSVSYRDQQVTGGVQTIPVIDQEKAARKTACENKLAFHKEKQAVFETFAGAFGKADPDQLLYLTIHQLKDFEVYSTVFRNKT